MQAALILQRAKHIVTPCAEGLCSLANLGKECIFLGLFLTAYNHSAI